MRTGAGDLSEAYALCRRVAHRSGPNFSVGFRFLPQPKRNAVYASYAFCRFVDDVVDENPDAAAADIRERIDAWEEELDRCYRGSPTHPITVALTDAATRYPIPEESFAGLIAGTLYQIFQFAYVTFQIGVSKYNAIYGSFTALPLFLIWLQLSWIILLFGAEISFAHQNEESYEFEPDCEKASNKFKKIVALHITHVCVMRFQAQKEALAVGAIP